MNFEDDDQGGWTHFENLLYVDGMRSRAEYLGSPNSQKEPSSAYPFLTFTFFP